MPKYLITGGCGFIGSHLARFLVNQGNKVVILDNLSRGVGENAPKQAEIVIGDIRDKEILKKVLGDVDGCFHLAAVASTEKSITHFSETHEINMLGTINVLEAILQRHPLIPIVFASSAAVYGNPKEMPIHEGVAPDPLTPYGVDKLACEKHLMVSWHLHKLPSISFRLFNVYGEGQDPSSSGVISIFSERIKQGKPLFIYGNGNQIRDFIYVGDVVRFLAKAITVKEGAHVFNLSSGRGVSLNQLSEILGSLCKKRVQKEYFAARKGDIDVSIGDPGKANSFFGMKVEVALELGLKKLL